MMTDLVYSCLPTVINRLCPHVVSCRHSIDVTFFSQNIFIEIICVKESEEDLDNEKAQL